jgi:ATP phosphoribosyltransferase
MSEPLTIAVPKGRILQVLGKLWEQAGLDTTPFWTDDRTLVRTSTKDNLRYLMLKPDDVPTYVEYGAADLGICGRDVLLERGYDLYEPLDLGTGRCKLVVAGPENGPPMSATPRVATKFVRVATNYFRSQAVQAEVIYVGGSVELAPLVGLADVIVDLVETGSTLRENHLEIRAVIGEITTVVVANRSAYKLRRFEVAPFLEQLRKVAHHLLRTERVNRKRSCSTELLFPSRQENSALFGITNANGVFEIRLQSSGDQ